MATEARIEAFIKQVTEQKANHKFERGEFAHQPFLDRCDEAINKAEQCRRMKDKAAVAKVLDGLADSLRTVKLAPAKE